MCTSTPSSSQAETHRDKVETRIKWAGEDQHNSPPTVLLIVAAVSIVAGAQFWRPQRRESAENWQDGGAHSRPRLITAAWGRCASFTCHHSWREKAMVDR